MRTMIIDQNSLIPRFLSTYVDHLPEDICKLRAVTAATIAMLSFVTFIIGMLLLGGFLTVDIIFTYKTIAKLDSFPFLFLCVILFWVLCAILCFFCTCEGVSRLYKYYKRQTTTDIFNQQTQPQTPVAKTFNVVSEMYHSAKERFCTKIEYR